MAPVAWNGRVYVNRLSERPHEGDRHRSVREGREELGALRVRNTDCRKGAAAVVLDEGRSVVGRDHQDGGGAVLGRRRDRGDEPAVVGAHDGELAGDVAALVAVTGSGADVDRCQFPRRVEAASQVGGEQVQRGGTACSCPRPAEEGVPEPVLHGEVEGAPLSRGPRLDGAVLGGAVARDVRRTDGGARPVVEGAAGNGADRGTLHGAVLPVDPRGQWLGLAGVDRHAAVPVHDELRLCEVVEGDDAPAAVVRRDEGLQGVVAFRQDGLPGVLVHQRDGLQCGVTGGQVEDLEVGLARGVSVAAREGELHRSALGLFGPADGGGAGEAVSGGGQIAVESAGAGTGRVDGERDAAGAVGGHGDGRGGQGRGAVGDLAAPVQLQAEGESDVVVRVVGVDDVLAARLLRLAQVAEVGGAGGGEGHGGGTVDGEAARALLVHLVAGAGLRGGDQGVLQTLRPPAGVLLHEECGGAGHVRGGHGGAADRGVVRVDHRAQLGAEPGRRRC